MDINKSDNDIMIEIYIIEKELKNFKKILIYNLISLISTIITIIIYII